MSGHLSNENAKNALKLSLEDVVKLRRNKVENYSNLSDM